MTDREKEKAKAEEAPAEEVSLPFTRPLNVGEKLRKAREDKGLDLAVVAQKLFIRTVYLEALEGGRTEDLPGGAYVTGFIRSYANYLSLPAEELVQQFRDENSRARKNAALRAMPASDREVILPKKHTLIGVVFLMLIFYLGWQAFSFYTKRDGLHVKSYLSIRQKAQGEAGGPPSPEPKQEQGSSAESAPEDAFLMNTLAGVDLQQVMAEGETATIQASSPHPQSYGQQTGETRIVVEALDETWIEVSKGRQVLISKFFRKDDRYFVPAGKEMISGEPMVLDTGNAGAVRLIVDGQPFEPLGEAGAKRKGVQLDADVLKNSLKGA